MPIICFFGTDGSGKSTLAKGMAPALEADTLVKFIKWYSIFHSR